MLGVPIIGIDFGTSNSTVGYPTELGPQLVKIDGDNFNIPSAIFYNLEILEPVVDSAQQTKVCSTVTNPQKIIHKPIEKYQIYFGREAISAYTNHYEGRLLRSLKSILGSSLIKESTQIGYEQIPFKEIICKFIKHLKNKAENYLGDEIDFVVMGRPVYFVDDDPEKDNLAQNELESIVLDCGFKNVFFQYEPIAAALDYERSVTEEELILVVDIGGGTSDFSIVRVSPDRRLKPDRRTDVLANTGVHVGGTDLDQKLSVGQFMHHLGYKTKQRIRPELDLPVSCYYDLATWYKIAFLYNKKTMLLLKELHSIAEKPNLIDRFIKIIRERNGHKLAGDIEAGKIVLSEKEAVDLSMDYVEKGLVASLSRKSFEENISREREKIVFHINECLKQAMVSAGEINTLFLTGGTSAIPSILNSCQSVIPEARLVEGDKFGSVGTGLAIHAGILSESIHHLIYSPANSDPYPANDQLKRIPR